MEGGRYTSFIVIYDSDETGAQKRKRRGVIRRKGLQFF